MGSCQGSPIKERNMDSNYIGIKLVNKYEPSDELIGIKTSYFEKFIEDNGGMQQFHGLSTKQVCVKCIEEKCQITNLSISQQLQNSSYGAKQYVGKPKWFISHSWSNLFLETVEAIIATFVKLYGQDARDIVVWIDIFSFFQGGNENVPFEYLNSTLIKNICDIENMMMVMIPWDKPLSLTRAWCLYEAFACFSTGSTFELALTRSDYDRFTESLQKNHNYFYDMFTSIHSMKSDSGKQSDKQLIHHAINTKCSSGYKELDEKLYDEMKKWLIKFLQGKISTITNLSDNASWRLALGNVYFKSGIYDDAESQYTRCVNIRRKLLGTDNLDTITSIHNLAAIYKAQKRYDLAEPLYKECALTRLRIMGMSSQDTRDSLNDLALIYQEQNKHDLAMLAFEGKINDAN